MQLADVKHEQRADDSEEAGGIDNEAPAYAGDADDNGGDGGTYNSGNVDECGVESDGIAEERWTHELGYERLTGRVVDGAQHSKGSAEDENLPEAYFAGENSKTEKERNAAET